MAMYCPQCGISFEQRLQCPECGGRLNVAEFRRSPSRFGLFARGWQHTSGGRVFVGLMLAQGLFYGLRHLLTGVLIAVQGQAAVQETLATMPGLIGVQVLQVIALLLGGTLAGVGRSNGLILGGLLGVLNGGVAVLAQQWPATASHSLLPVYTLPLLHGVVGALGGWIGCTIWRPLPVVLGPEAANVKKKGLYRPQMALFAGKIHWFRIAFGSVFAIAGCLSATYLLERVAIASNDALTTDSFLQEKLVTWEIKALSMLFAGALAGACTTNGFKQGVFVGILSGGVLNVLLGLRGASFEAVGLTMLSSLCLSLAGGWFGSQLFPPVSAYKRVRGMGPASLS